jgi:hypothetical protein
MNKLIAGVVAAFALAAISIPAIAAEAMSKEQATTKPAGAKPRDCSKAPNKARCEARNQALEECKDVKTPKAHRQCMAKEMKEYAEKSKPAAKTK